MAAPVVVSSLRFCPRRPSKNRKVITDYNYTIQIFQKKNKILRISTSDGLYLHDYYVPAEDKKIAVLNIHGMNGNFYEVNYVYVLADALEKNGVGFLTVNTRGNGKDTDFVTVH